MDDARAITAFASVAEQATPAAAQPVTLEGAFRAYASYVAAIGRRILGRDGEVEDLVQEVFVQAATGLERVYDFEALKPWLATITVRMARRRLRVRRLRAFLGLDGGDSYEHVAAPGASPEHRALLARVYAALDGLPVEQRLAWTLRHVEGEGLEDVARLCGCSLATAKRRISDAHHALQEVVSGG